MSKIDNYEMFSLVELQNISDEHLKQRLLLEYDRDFAQLIRYFFIKEKLNFLYGESLNTIYQIYEKAIIEHTSIILFPGHIVNFYDKTKMHRSKNVLFDDLGNYLGLGSLYYTYRPMLWDETTNDTYILKRSIRVEEGSGYLLPDNLHDFEQLGINLFYQKDLKDLQFHYDQGLTLMKLNKKRKQGNK